MNPTLGSILSVASGLEVPEEEIVQRDEAVLGKGWQRETSS
jgi:hypothetical protein